MEGAVDRTCVLKKVNHFNLFIHRLRRLMVYMQGVIN